MKLKKSQKVKSKKKYRSKVWSVIIFLLTILMVGVSSFFLIEDMNSVISNTVIAGMGSLLLLFVLFQAIIKDRKQGESSFSIFDFIGIYIIGLLFSCIFPLMSVGGWFYPAIGVALALFSNAIIGIVSVSILLTFSVLIAQADAHIFILYFISSLVGIMVFQNIDLKFKVRIPIFITLLSLFVSTTAMNIMFINDTLGIDTFIVPFINLFVTGITLVIVLNLFSHSTIYKNSNIYLAINDQEYPLLQKLKETNKEVYYNAIHCSYLCEKIGRVIGADEVNLKGLGYYHKIGQLENSDSWETCKKICLTHSFPPKLVKLLKEYLDHDTKYTSKEVIILIFVEEMISTVMELFQENPTVQIDYNDLFTYIIKQKYYNEELNDSELTLCEFTTMKKIFMEETLYYDFLR